MADHAVAHRQLADRHLQLVGRCLQQHDARRRTRAADIILGGADAAAAAGRHVAPHALACEVLTGRDAIDRNLVPVAFELFDDELRETGERALPHLGARDADDGGVVGLDHDPGVDLGPALLRDRRINAERRIETQRQSAAGRSRATMNVRRVTLAAETFADLPLIFFVMADLPRRGWWRPCARPHGCADRCRSDRCWSSRHRCRRHSAWDSS